MKLMESQLRQIIREEIVGTPIGRIEQATHAIVDLSSTIEVMVTKPSKYVSKKDMCETIVRHAEQIATLAATIKSAAEEILAK